MSQDYTMYIIINNDLNMGKGKIASQVGHVVQHIIEDLLESYYNSNKIKDKYSNYLKWKNGCKKIVLKASQADLLYCLENYDCVPVYDLGKTQIEANSLTCVGFYPSNTNSQLFTKFKLL
jgi:peptidyl-tRNA hydrolase